MKSAKKHISFVPGFIAIIVLLPLPITLARNVVNGDKLRAGRGLHVSPLLSEGRVRTADKPLLFRKTVNEVTVLFTATHKGELVKRLAVQGRTGERRRDRAPHG